ncbi:MAG: acyl-ACP--UDP-N-acetylglucosamine O-acyltransferase [Proteobacteria bacterium]|nr:acyl-ACP--UDP-N-acetylglucosamine O-acyltransferase [Pseudomonadota bacterium]MDA0966501.1 acyl-ACP--UDP-N-acetylglucosamine O-acyltransferase [Pseudomonadota bacterium]
MNKIHATAIIEDGAKIGNNVEIGAYTVVGANVVIGDNVKIYSHVAIDGYTTIGEGTRIFPFASIGHIPQDLKFQGEKSTLVIGKNNTIREHVTMNPGTQGDAMTTIIGDNCLFMVGAHVAHDCVVGNRVILANNATLAGHVKVGDFAVIGGLAAIHQFVRIGHHAMIGGMSGIENDVIPYGQAMGERANLCGLNLVGLKRGNFKREEIHTLRNAYRLIFSQEGTLQERMEDAAEMFKDNIGVKEIIEFIRTNSSRAICQPKHDSVKNADAA